MRSRASLTRLTVPGAIKTPQSVDTPAARSGNDLLIEAAPVGRFHPQRADHAAVRTGNANRPVRQATAKSRTAAPEKTPRAPTETEAANACDVPKPAATSAAVPAPAWEGAPAGPNGTAAAAAPAQRNRSASGNE